jgi:hypothetical protein
LVEPDARSGRALGFESARLLYPMMAGLDIALRIADSGDIAQLRDLYAAAVRGLAPVHYSS